MLGLGELVKGLSSQRRVSMNHSDRRTSAKHGWIHLVLVCGLMLVGIVALSLLGLGWGSAIFGAALVICLVAMLAMMGAAGDDQ
jgi:protein-S-isoprenylcysteine O-methyltransferase Ste14